MGKDKEHDAETNPDKSRDTREFKTNIKSLDRLLGYNEDLGSGTGIRPGDIIVLRGGPGSGKTTLGLQIMSSYLESIDCQIVEKKPAAVFLSLELDPSKVIEKVEGDYGFFKKGQRLHIELVSPKKIDRLIDKLGQRFSTRTVGYIERGFFKALIKVACYFGLEAIVARIVEEHAKELVDPIYNRISHLLRSLVENRKIEPPGKDNVGGILFIDSINVLLTMIHQRCLGPKWEPRLVLKRACESLRSMFGNFVIIASSEFHYDNSHNPSGISESFLSDVEISLSSELLSVPLGYQTGQQGSAGYNIFKIIEKVKGEEGTKLESRSFIRVLKNRKGANQSRRCAYDIVSGVGIQFYDTYPGDGHVLLFSENPKQEQVWETFFDEDLPQLYPALRYEAFDRSSLQRTFLNQKRSRYVPSRTDMYLSSFDNYWVNWYGELCWRRAVAEGVAENVQATKENETDIALLISAIHRSLMEKPPKMMEYLSEIPELEEIRKEFKKDIADELVTAFASLSRKRDCVKCFLCRASWWLLTRIAGQKGPHYNKQDTIDDSDQKGIRRDAPEFQTLFDKMSKVTTTECCEESLVRRLFQDLEEEAKNGGQPSPFDVGKVIGSFQQLSKPEKRAYIVDPVPEDLEDLIQSKTKEIHEILKSEKTNPNPELSKKIGELAPFVRSEKVRKKLEEELWNRKKNAKPEALESQIKEVLKTCFAQEIGCECAVEFRNYLEYYSTKRIDALKNGPEEGKEGKPSGDDFERVYSSLLQQSQGILSELFGFLPCSLLEETGEPESIVELWKKCTGEDSYCAQYSILIVYCEILRKRNNYHFLRVILDEKLRLFGERRSRIIGELEGPSTENKRPIHRPGLLFSLRDTRSFIAVPYDANIGFLVYRHDLLKTFISRHILAGGEREDALSKYVEEVLQVYQEQFDNVDSQMSQALPPSTIKDEIGKLIKGNIERYVKNERFSDGPLQTWEELTALLQLMNKSRPSLLRDDKPQWHFVIETQTLDSLLCTILEILWNCGGNLAINPDYSIENEQDTEEKLFQALYLLGTMLHKGIIPEDSTLDVTHFANRYTKSPESEAVNESGDWVFARHWYSTLVDLLTTKKERAHRDSPEGTEARSSGFRWQNPNAELGIMPIPMSLSYYLECVSRVKHDPNTKVPHVSCWGDWHWIMTEGTENNELGIELINNLVSSQKVCERAFQCAAIPTVEEFYTLYGNSRCLNLPERRYDTPELLPEITFRQLRDTYFPRARSRSQIFDYEHCMLELQSLFHFVRNVAKKEPPPWGELRREIGNALARIKDLRRKRILAV